MKLLPDPREDPLHPLGAPKRVEEHEVAGHCVGGEDNSDWTAHLGLWFIYDYITKIKSNHKTNLDRKYK